MKRRGRILIKRQVEPPRKGSFVVEANIVRSEELRVDRLGPSEDDVIPDLVTGSEIRPSRSLGNL